ncbi:hypothetical protein SRHO_G00164160, partial [Serrasalmus rhombeus]
MHISLTDRAAAVKQMSFHSGRGCPRGRPPPGQHGSPQNYRPTGLRLPTPQPPMPPYPYDPPAPHCSGYSVQGANSYMPPRPEFMPYPIPALSQGPQSQCPIRPPFPNPPLRQGFPEPPNFPPPPLPGSSTNVAQSQGSNPYMISSPEGSSFKPEHFPRHPPQYKGEKSRSPERPRRHEEHRHKSYGYSGHGERHKAEYGGERKDRGRSPEVQRRRTERYRSEHERGRTPPRHRSRERSRERYRHRDSRSSPPSDRHRKRPRSRSASRERKRGRMEEERERRSEGGNRERSYTSTRSSRESEELSSDQRHDEEKEKEEEELLKPAWIRCTHAENYYSNDPMDQVGDSTVVGTSKLRDLYERFEEELGRRQERAKSSRPKWEPPKTKLDLDQDESSSESECDSDGDSSCSSSSDSEVFDVIAEIKRKKAHPDRLHDELWYNDPGQMNDGPLCKCSAKARRTGIRTVSTPE